MSFNYTELAKSTPGVIAWDTKTRTVVLNYSSVLNYTGYTYDLVSHSRIIAIYKSVDELYTYKTWSGTSDAVEKLEQLLDVKLTAQWHSERNLNCLHMNDADKIVMKLKYGHLL